MSDPRLQITVCGGGNGAHVSAGFLGSKSNLTVNVFTRQPKKWKNRIKVTTKTSTWKHKGDFHGRLNRVSSDPADVCAGTNIFIIAAPANAHPALLQAIAPYVEEGAWVGALYAQGGFDWAAKDAFGEKFDSLGCIFGLQNIPWICKTTTYGAEARILGPKKELFVATYPVEKKELVAEWLGYLYDIPCTPIPNFLNLTLTPSNQIIHPARYFGIFYDWDGKRAYSERELKKREGMTLYEDMDEFSAEQLAILDNELQQLKKGLEQRFPELKLPFIMPIGERIVKQYGPDVANSSSLRQIFRTNKGYVGCGTPMKKVSGGFIPNVDCRLFWEDIPYGLCILKNLAEYMDNMPTPKIDQMIEWHQQFMGKTFLVNNQLNPDTIHLTGTPAKYNILDIEGVVATSMPQGYMPVRNNSSIRSHSEPSRVSPFQPRSRI